MRRIPTKCLKKDSVIATDVYDGDFKLLIKKNSKVNEKTIEALKRFNIISVYIIDEYSNEELDEVISIELRLKAAKELKDMAYEFKQKKMNVVREDYVERIKVTVNEIIDELLDKKKLLLQQIDIRNVENYNFLHSVNVTIMSIVLGIKLNYDREKLEKIGLATMLHDVGKVFVPKELLFKENRTEEEENAVRYHCEAGYNYLSKFKNVDEKIKNVVLQHHELIDGSGYPKRLKGNQIDEFSRIIGVADFYDRVMASGYMLGDNLPSDILEQIMAYSNSTFDFEIVRTFFGIAKPFLEGTIVKLNNGDVAIVKGTIKGMPLRPIVKVIRSDKEERIGGYVDLSMKLDVTIVKILYYID